MDAQKVQRMWRKAQTESSLHPDYFQNDTKKAEIVTNALKIINPLIDELPRDEFSSAKTAKQEIKIKGMLLDLAFKVYDKAKVLKIIASMPKIANEPDYFNDYDKLSKFNTEIRPANLSEFKEVANKYGLTAEGVKKATIANDNRALEIMAERMKNDKDGNTFLHFAANFGSTYGLELGLKKHDIDIINTNGVTPLMEAATNGNSDCVELLANKGANLDLQDKYDLSALMYAAENKHSNCVDLLTSKGANLDLQDNSDRSALMYAARNGKSDCVELLTSKGANLDLQDIYGKSALMYAAENGKSDCVELLANKGANLDLQDIYGKSALYYASDVNDFEKACEIMETLVFYGANMDLKDIDNDNPLNTRNDSVKNKLRELGWNG
jgi:ankyrin repeat protein